MSEYDIEIISGDSYELDIIYRDLSQAPKTLQTISCIKNL